MLRKGGIISIAILHLVVTAGFTVNMHYCTGRLVDLSILVKPQDCCGTQETCHLDTKSCCDDKTIVIQLDQWQVVTTLPVYRAVNLPVVPWQPKAVEIASYFAEPLAKEHEFHPPPAKPLWLLYQRMTYYS